MAQRADPVTGQPHRPGPAPRLEELAQLRREPHLSLGPAHTPVMPGTHAPITQPHATAARMRRWPPRAVARPAAAGVPAYRLCR
jgi:hypothetical protein